MKTHYIFLLLFSNFIKNVVKIASCHCWWEGLWMPLAQIIAAFPASICFYSQLITEWWVWRWERKEIFGGRTRGKWRMKWLFTTAFLWAPWIGFNSSGERSRSKNWPFFLFFVCVCLKDLVKGMWLIAVRTVLEKLWLQEELLWGPGDQVWHKDGQEVICCAVLYKPYQCYGSLRLWIHPKKAQELASQASATLLLPLARSAGLLAVSGTGLLPSQDVCTSDCL